MSYPGLFAHGLLDSGTRLLISALPRIERSQSVLDFGCGIGVVGLAVRQNQPDCTVSMLDVDALAMHAARQNAPFARPLLSDGWASCPETFDLVVSNPPYHVQTTEDISVLRAFVTEAPAHLNVGGVLALVTQRRLPTHELLAGKFERVTVAADEGPYRVWHASAPKHSGRERRRASSA